MSIMIRICIYRQVYLIGIPLVSCFTKQRHHICRFQNHLHLIYVHCWNQFPQSPNNWNFCQMFPHVLMYMVMIQSNLPASETFVYQSRRSEIKVKFTLMCVTLILCALGEWLTMICSNDQDVTDWYNYEIGNTSWWPAAHCVNQIKRISWTELIKDVKGVK